MGGRGPEGGGAGSIAAMQAEALAANVDVTAAQVGDHLAEQAGRVPSAGVIFDARNAGVFR